MQKRQNKFFIWGWGGSSTEGCSRQAHETPNCKSLVVRRALWGSILRCLPGSCTPLLANAIAYYQKENHMSGGPSGSIWTVLHSYITYIYFDHIKVSLMWLQIDFNPSYHHNLPFWAQIHKGKVQGLKNSMSCHHDSVCCMYHEESVIW